jgi:protein-S-isoprenylcysteine O-methyltransferase Ste14
MLVTRGPYRFAQPDVCGRASRDPWLGSALSIHGHLEIRVRRGSLLSSFRRPREEPHLRRAFGVEYENYCARVGRWLPKR